MQTSFNRAHTERAIRQRAETLKAQGLTQPAVIGKMAKEGFPVWENWALRHVAVGLGEPRLNASNWVAQARANDGWVPEAPEVNDGNGRDADEEVHDQIGREADDSEKRDAQASSEIPMTEKETPGCDPGGKEIPTEVEHSASESEGKAISSPLNGVHAETDAILARAALEAEAQFLATGLPAALLPLADQRRWVVWKRNWAKTARSTRCRTS